MLDHTYKSVLALSWLKQRSPSLSELTGDYRLWHRAFWSCCLHDFGKAAKEFQTVLRGKSPNWKHRHEILSLAFLPCVVSPESEDFPWIAACIASHHKDASEILNERYNPRLYAEDLDLNGLVNNLVLEEIHALLIWLDENTPAWISNLGFADANVSPSPIVRDDFSTERFHQCAINNLLISLGAYQDLFRSLMRSEANTQTNRVALVLRGLVTHADHLSSANAPPFAGVVFPPPPELAKRLNLKHLYEHQESATKIEGSVMLTAPTGSGKTEAALFWAYCQQSTKRPIPVFIYLLPYQASLNAMRQRLGDLFPNIEVALLHGRALEALYRELSAQGYTPAEGEHFARRVNDLSRLHHSPIWCATPYQLLRAAYRLPGYEALWTSLSDALIVVDEVHAYEPVRIGMFLELLAELKRQWGVRICCMTATMPSWLSKLIRDYISDWEIPVDKRLFGSLQRHKLQIMDGQITDSEVLKLINAEVSSGHSILVSVNTVSDAQQVYSKLKQLLGANKVMLLHSRFTLHDRLKKEEFLEHIFSPYSSQGTAMAIVATQVIEVSLNLDFDTSITEPAPLEALIQRFGRVNRLGRKGTVPVRILTTPSKGSLKVYDPRLVNEAVRVLTAKNGTTLDELTISHLLDMVYKTNGLEEEYLGKVKHHEREFRQSCLASLRAFQSDEDLAEHFDKLFDGTEVLPTSLEKEYAKKRQASILEAKELLVPISYSQLKFIRKRVHWNKDWRLHILDLPYDGENGLYIEP